MSKEKKPTKFENRLLVIVLAIVLGITVVPILWNHFTQSEVIESGVAATAEVIKVTDTGDRFNSNPIVLIELKVTDSNGKEFSATVKTPLSAVRIATLQPGKTVPVKYDPEDNSKVAIVFGE